MIKVKICGLTRRCDVDSAIELGADFLGFVLEKSSPRAVRMADIPSLTADIPDHVKCVGIIGAEFEEAWADWFDVLQFHGRAPLRRIPGRESWLAVSNQLPEFQVDALVVDSVCGGSGRLADWTLAARAARQWRVFLAGGISADNVLQAIAEVKLYGVDLSSSLEESPGIKSKEKMRKFFNVIRG